MTKHTTQSTSEVAFYYLLSDTTGMALSKTFTTVTPLSKTVALLVFILLPIIAFLFGMSYQRMLDGNQNIISVPFISKKQTACTMEAKLCPDGTAVGRSGPNCDFAPCPTPLVTTPSAPQFSNTEDYTCPQEEYINCMPGFGQADTRCATEFLQWAQKSCEGFKGATY